MHMNRQTDGQLNIYIDIAQNQYAHFYSGMSISNREQFVCINILNNIKNTKIIKIIYELLYCEKFDCINIFKKI